jgi:hypothetical protein
MNGPSAIANGQAGGGGLCDPQLAAAERKAIDLALGLIRDRHESGRVPDHMHYHNSAHTAGVIDRARAIGIALNLSERHLLLTVIAAAFHDTVQRWTAVPGEGGVVMRRRMTGRDEVASAHEAVEAMAGLGPHFTPEEMGIVASAIVGTIPGWDNESSTVAQPFLIEHGVIRAVALADLGAAGMDPDMYRRDGPALFAEENLDIMETVAAARLVKEVPAAAQRFYRARYIAWLKVQPGFARGREIRLVNGELDGLEASARDRVLALFSRFEESISAAEAAVVDAESLGFAPLMRQLHATAFPDEQ